MIWFFKFFFFILIFSIKSIYIINFFFIEK